jgi:thiamine kinase
MLNMPDIQTLILELPVLRGAEVIEYLAGGPASECWLVKNSGRKMVVRIDQPQARKLGLDREAERDILRAISSESIGPQVILANPGDGLLITSYIDGAAWDQADIHDPRKLQELATVLRRLHALPSVGRKFNPAGAASTYAEETGTKMAFDLANQVTLLADDLFSGGHQGVLCHNDLVHRNIIGCDPVRLIDWEYAGVGDPFFDLATVVRHHDLPPVLADHFLQTYCGTVDSGSRQRFDAFCHLYDLLASLWYMSICAQPEADDSYRNELERVLNRLQA